MMYISIILFYIKTISLVTMDYLIYTFIKIQCLTHILNREEFEKRLQGERGGKCKSKYRYILTTYRGRYRNAAPHYVSPG